MQEIYKRTKETYTMTRKNTLLAKQIYSMITHIIGLSNSKGYSSALILNSRQGRRLDSLKASG